MCRGGFNDDAGGFWIESSALYDGVRMNERTNFVFCGRTLACCSSSVGSKRNNAMMTTTSSTRTTNQPSRPSTYKARVSYGNKKQQRGNKLKPREEQRTWGNKNVLMLLSAARWWYGGGCCGVLAFYSKSIKCNCTIISPFWHNSPLLPCPSLPHSIQQALQTESRTTSTLDELRLFLHNETAVGECGRLLINLSLF